MTSQKLKLTAQSPGRINIIGEHTDYNDGFVLPAAIDKKTIFKLQVNSSPDLVRVTALNMGEDYSFRLNDFAPLESGWQNYVMGVVHELQELGAQIKGFDAEFEGDVPIGGGMSSSASLECSLAMGLNELFDLGLDNWQIIRASQAAEHNYVGIKCGIMDQFASVMGKKDQVMLLDCRSLEYQYFPFDLGKYQLLLLNTNVSHSLASSEYNTRRSECEQGVNIIQSSNLAVKNLRDVSLEMLSIHKDLMEGKIYDRCLHVVSENDRVQKATKALLQKDFEKLGALVYQSHESLQHRYEVSCKELDFLVDLTREKEYVLGSRMMGGGFGGCTINIIDKQFVNEFTEIAKKAYEEEFAIKLTPYEVSIENGTEVFK